MNPADHKQIEYLDKLLTDLRSRFYAGDKSVEGQIRATSAKLEQLRLAVLAEQPQPTTVLDLAKAMVEKVKRKCCRG